MKHSTNKRSFRDILSGTHAVAEGSVLAYQLQGDILLAKLDEALPHLEGEAGEGASVSGMGMNRRFAQPPRIPLRHACSGKIDSFTCGNKQSTLNYLLLTSSHEGLVRSLSFPLEKSRDSLDWGRRIKRNIDSAGQVPLGGDIPPVPALVEELRILPGRLEEGLTAQLEPVLPSVPTQAVELQPEPSTESLQEEIATQILLPSVLDGSPPAPCTVVEAVTSSGMLPQLPSRVGPLIPEACKGEERAQPLSDTFCSVSCAPGASNSADAVTTGLSCMSDDTCPPYGTLSVCGRRREMEDTYTVEPDFVLLPCNSMGGCQCVNTAQGLAGSLHFFGVYDGHGGTQASSFCKLRLHKALIEELIKAVRSFKRSDAVTKDEWCLRWEKVMTACFQKIDEEVGGVCPTGGCNIVWGNPNCCVNPIAPDNVGSTAVVAIIGACQIIVGNCGDSRAVLSRGGKAIPLSRDHKPDREDEMNRIEAAGGRVIYWEGYRVSGFLAMSRAIGDRFLKQYIIAVPEVTCMQRSKEDECLILASDGLWDKVTNEMACDLARRCLKVQRRKCAKAGTCAPEETPAAAAASLLTKVALSRGSKDNITVIVVDLKSRRKQLAKSSQ